MTTTLQNSIWPNAGGILGQIKVQIPTGTASDTIKWPQGDALVHNFVFNKGKLVGFVDTKALIANSSKTTTFPYEYVNISLPSIAEGEMTYNYDQCAYFVLNGKVLKGDIPTNEDDVPSDDELEIITKKYTGCKTLADIMAVDPDYLTNDIVDGVWTEGLGDLEQGNNGKWNEGMFYWNLALTSFTSDLSSLTDGRYMFYKCENLKSFTSDLPSLTNGGSMFWSCFNLNSFTTDLPSLTNGYDMFYNCYNLTAFNSDLSSLTNGHTMFNGCPLTTFNIELPKLTIGQHMFSYCHELTSWNIDLPSLTGGNNMFRECTNLTSWNINLPNLTDGSAMFSGCSQLESFTSDLSSLTNGGSMFYGCNLTSWNINLPNLTDGSSMFNNCTNLTSFNSNLSSLMEANYMFLHCKLDTASVQNIADTINTASNKKLDIGIGNESPNEQEVAAFNQMVSKGWIVFVNSNYYGGDEGGYYGYTANASLASSAMTLDEMGESEMFNPKPYWAKPINSDEQNARYVDSEGNFYNIIGAQFIYGDNLETYGMFTCEEDAAAQMRLKKIGEEEIETA